MAKSQNRRDQQAEYRQLKIFYFSLFFFFSFSAAMRSITYLCADTSRKHGQYAPAGARGLVAAAIISAASALCPSSLYPSAMSFHSFQPAWNRGRALPQTFKMVSATVPRQGIPPDLAGKWPPAPRLHMQQVHALHAVSSMACFTSARTRKHKHMARLALPSPSSTIAPQPLPTAQVKTPRAPFIFYSLLALFCFLFITLTSPSVEVALLVDYYGAVLPLSGIILASSAPSLRSRVSSGIWAALCIFLGSPLCCAYVLMRLIRHRSLRLVTLEETRWTTPTLPPTPATPTPVPPAPTASAVSAALESLAAVDKSAAPQYAPLPTAPDSESAAGKVVAAVAEGYPPVAASVAAAATRKRPKLAIAFYVFLAMFCTLFLGGSAPSVEVALVMDYYGVVLPLCGLVLASERLWVGCLWSAGCLFLGSPVCCGYVLMRLWRHKTLSASRLTPPLPLPQ